MRRTGLTATTIAVVGLLMMVAGCAPGGTPGPSATPLDTGPISYATGPTDLVLQVSSGGGLLPQSMLLAEMPDVSIYGDGRAVRLGSHGTGSKDPLLPQLIETRVTADGMARILGAAREAGALGPDRHYDLPDTYDLWTVKFTVTADGRTHHVSAFALGFKDEERLAPPGEMDARRNLNTLNKRLLDLRAWLPAGTVGADAAYEPAGTRVYVTRLVGPSTAVGSATAAPASPRAGQEVRAWPFAGLPESFGTAVDRQGIWYCAVVEQDQATALGLDTATWDTRWQVAGYLYQVVARPLLPDESGCPAGI